MAFVSTSPHNGGGDRQRNTTTCITVVKNVGKEKKKLFSSWSTDTRAHKLYRVGLKCQGKMHFLLQILLMMIYFGNLWLERKAIYVIPEPGLPRLPWEIGFGLGLRCKLHHPSRCFMMLLIPYLFVMRWLYCYPEREARLKNPMQLFGTLPTATSNLVVQLPCSPLRAGLCAFTSRLCKEITS